MISNQLRKVILSQLGLDDWDIRDSTNAGQIPGWDSLSHAMIIAAVEDEFGVRFTTREVLQLATVGQLQELLNRKTG